MEKLTFGQLFNKDVKATNMVNPSNFSLLVQYKKNERSALSMEITLLWKWHNNLNKQCKHKSI